MEGRKMSRKKRFKTDIALILAIVFAFVQMLPGVVVANGDGIVSGSFSAEATPIITDINVLSEVTETEHEGSYRTDVDMEAIGVQVEFTFNETIIDLDLALKTTMTQVADSIQTQLDADENSDVSVEEVRNADDDRGKLKITAQPGVTIVIEGSSNLNSIGLAEIEVDPSASLNPGDEYTIEVAVHSPAGLSDTQLSELIVKLWHDEDGNATQSAFDADLDTTNPVTYASITWERADNEANLSAGAFFEEGHDHYGHQWLLSSSNLPTSAQLESEVVTDVTFEFNVRIGKIAKPALVNDKWQIAAIIINDSDMPIEDSYVQFDKIGSTEGINMNWYGEVMVADGTEADFGDNIEAGTTSTAISVSGISMIGNADFSQNVKAADVWTGSSSDSVTRVAINVENETIAVPEDDNTFGVLIAMTSQALSATGIKGDPDQSVTVTTSGALASGALEFTDYDSSTSSGDDFTPYLFLALSEDFLGGQKFTGDITFVIGNLD